MTRKTVKKKVTLEGALNSLEEIISDMESEELSLEDSLTKYQEGIEIIKLCTQKLQAAEKKVEVLVKTENGTYKKRPFKNTERPDILLTEE
ncbi:exodeoxyribonuclease VII small subunit [Chlamydiota bacterium]